MRYQSPFLGFFITYIHFLNILLPISNEFFYPYSPLFIFLSSVIALPSQGFYLLPALNCLSVYQYCSLHSPLSPFLKLRSIQSFLLGHCLRGIGQITFFYCYFLPFSSWHMHWTNSWKTLQLWHWSRYAEKPNTSMCDVKNIIIYVSDDTTAIILFLTLVFHYFSLICQSLLPLLPLLT